MVRKRTTGNWLWKIYSTATQVKQLLFKTELLELREGKDTLWNSFNRTETQENKLENFNAEVVGAMVKTLLDEEIKLKFQLTDLEKLKFKFRQIELQESQTVLPLYNQKQL